MKGKAVNSECHRQTGKHLKEIHVTTVVMEGEASRVTEQLGAKTDAWDGRGDGACAPHHARLTVTEAPQEKLLCL